MFDEFGALRETVNQYILWGIKIGFLYLCYKYYIVRNLGFLVGCFCVIAALVNTFITMPGADHGDLWASAMIILGVCSFAQFSTRK